MDQKALGVICIFYFIKTVQKDKFELRNISFLSPTLHACFYGVFFVFCLHILLVTLCIMVNETKNSKHLRFSNISLFGIMKPSFLRTVQNQIILKKQDLKSTKRFESHSTQQNIFEYYYQPYYDYMDKQHDS